MSTPDAVPMPKRLPWRGWLVVACLAVCAAGWLVEHARREQQAGATPAEVFSTVENQITAFSARDVDSAWRLCSAEYQARISPMEFGETVAGAFPSAARLSRVELAETRLEGDRALVRAVLILKSGGSQTGEFELVHEEGHWRVNHARMRPVEAARGAGMRL